MRSFIISSFLYLFYCFIFVFLFSCSNSILKNSETEKNKQVSKIAYGSWMDEKVNHAFEVGMYDYLLKEPTISSSMIVSGPASNDHVMGIFYGAKLNFEAPGILKDPHNQIVMGSFKRPDGSYVYAAGVWVGGKNYQMRFMPDQRGVWSASFYFNDYPSVKGYLIFYVADSDIPGKLTAYSINPTWTGYTPERGMKPVSAQDVRGGATSLTFLHVAELFTSYSKEAKAKRDQILPWMRKKGINGLSIAGFALRDQEGRGKVNGKWRSETPRLDVWPPSEQTLKEWNEFIKILEELAYGKYRFAIYLFSGIFGNGDALWYDRWMENKRVTDEFNYFAMYAMARLWHLYNMYVVNIAGPEIITRNKPQWLTFQEVGVLGYVLKYFDPFGDYSQIGVHHGPVASRPETLDPKDKYPIYSNGIYRYFVDNNFKGLPAWKNHMDILQGYKGVNWEVQYRGVVESSDWFTNTFAQEMVWTRDKLHSVNFNDVDYLRKAFWSTFFVTGATGCYGQMGTKTSTGWVTGNSSAGFAGSLDFNDVDEKLFDVYKRYSELIKEIPNWWELRRRPKDTNFFVEADNNSIDKYVFGMSNIYKPEYFVYFVDELRANWAKINVSVDGKYIVTYREAKQNGTTIVKELGASSKILKLELPATTNQRNDWAVHIRLK